MEIPYEFCGHCNFDKYENHLNLLEGPESAKRETLVAGQKIWFIMGPA